MAKPPGATMQATVRPLFEIAIHHAYHVDGGCRGLRLAPRGWSCGAATLRSSADGGVVFVDPSARIQQSWSFDLIPVDPGFSYYTALGGPSGSIVAFAPSRGASGDDRSIALVPAIVARRSRRFRERLGPPFAGGRVDIVSMRDGRAIGVAASDDPYLVVDVGEEPDGLFRLVADGTTLFDFHASADVGSRAWGVIDVPTPVLPASRLTLYLAARALTWRYHIVDGGDARRSVETATLRLEERDRSAEPRGSFVFVRREIVGGREACLFQSNGPIALSDRPGSAFKLTLNGDGSNRHRQWSEPLPFAGARQVIGENGGYVADVFVYL